MAGPSGDEGDEEAEDGGFGEGEVVDGVWEKLVLSKGHDVESE